MHEVTNDGDGFHRFLINLILLSGKFVSHDAIKCKLSILQKCQPPTVNCKLSWSLFFPTKILVFVDCNLYL